MVEMQTGHTLPIPYPWALHEILRAMAMFDCTVIAQGQWVVHDGDFLNFGSIEECRRPALFPEHANKDYPLTVSGDRLLEACACVHSFVNCDVRRMAWPDGHHELRIWNDEGSPFIVESEDDGLLEHLRQCTLRGRDVPL